MSNIETLQHEMKEIKQTQKLILKLLSPKQYTIGRIVEITGRSRQAVRSWLISNAEPDVGFTEKNGKILVSEEVALEYINTRR